MRASNLFSICAVKSWVSLWRSVVLRDRSMPGLTAQVHRTVYRVPPRKSNAGYRAEEWGDLSAYLWKGRMRIIESSDKCTIRLEDATTG